MTDLLHLLDHLDRTFDGDAWHGPSVMPVISSVSATQAAARRIGPAHSIWEIVCHMTAWKLEVVKRLRGGPARDLPPDEDFPVAHDATPEAWTATVRSLVEAHNALRACVATLREVDLDAPIDGAERDAAWTVGDTVRGIIDHDLYHLGQIVLLRKS